MMGANNQLPDDRCQQLDELFGPVNTADYNYHTLAVPIINPDPEGIEPTHSEVELPKPHHPSALVDPNANRRNKADK
jgi:hypothetical protein